MEVINWNEHKGDIVGWFIIKAITKAGDGILGTPGFDSTALNVTLTINGVEVPCQEMLEYWASCLDEEAAKKAKELIDSEVSETINELEELRKRMVARVPWKWDE